MTLQPAALLKKLMPEVPATQYGTQFLGPWQGVFRAIFRAVFLQKKPPQNDA
jgi:hypothetical protein